LLFVFSLLLTGSAAVFGQGLVFQGVVVDGAVSGDDKTVADIDLDGFPDGVVGGASLDWWRSNGAARSFTKHHLRDAAVEFTTDMEAADVDGDGDPDLVFADGPGTDNVQWLENPKLSPPPGVPPDPTVGANWIAHPIGSHGGYAHDLEVGRIDGDALPDVVSLGNGFFRIHFQNAGGTWTTADFVQHANDGSPAIADIDGDGDNDLFVAGGWIENPPGGRRNPANWTFHAIANSNPGDGPAAAAFDVDRDGRVDLVTAPQHVTGALAWLRNPADPTSPNWPRTLISGATGSHHLRAADFDGDARLDLLTGLELSDITVWRIHGAGANPVFTPYPVATTGGHNAAAADFDGNGWPDVWSCDYIGHPPLRVLWNSPAGLFRDGFESADTTRWPITVP
jgi:FG-GAP-like repeat